MLAVPTASPVVVGRGPLGVGHRLPDHAQGLPVGLRPDGRALDHPAHPVEVGDVLGRQDPHEHAPVEPVVQQPLVAEQPEGLAQRVARHAERLAMASSDRRWPGLKKPFGDAVAQDVGHPLGRAATSETRRGPVRRAAAASSTDHRKSSNKPLVELFNDPYVRTSPPTEGAMDGRLHPTDPAGDPRQPDRHLAGVVRLLPLHHRRRRWSSASCSSPPSTRSTRPCWRLTTNAVGSWPGRSAGSCSATSATATAARPCWS